ncbi:MAG: hypothetical protein LBC27_05350 [Spirochaetaceae bacterium]|jgi:hypothetical protein|nr:hypothetical protein [Spirochaetaceae bacterium]
MLIDVKIGKSRIIKNATCYRAGMWRFPAYSNQKKLLPFMKKGPSISLYAVKVEEMIINYIYYEEAESFSALSPGRFYQEGSICYFIALEIMPPWIFRPGFKVTIAFGLTTGGTYRRDKVVYRGGLDYYPAIKETTDNIEAAKMKFNTGSITLDNTDGFYDDAYSFFGNVCQVFSRDESGVYPLYEYYIKNLTARLAEVKLTLGDKRERLSQKIPQDKFTLEKYPYMQNTQNPEKTELSQKSGSLGKVIPDAYGYCVNIPAICIDPYQIYETDPVAGQQPPALKAYRTFKVCRKIIRLDKVMVKMTQPDGSGSNKEVWTDQKALGHIRSIDYNNGEFTMNRNYCMPEFTGYQVPELYDVTVTGVFGLPESDCAPAKIINDIMLNYGGVPFNDKYYNTAVFNSELSPLSLIGIYLNKEQDIFGVIEQIQNGSNYSFQFITDFNRFSAKRNDDGREVKTVIKADDIISLSDVEYDTNTDEYATIIDIGYAQNYLDDTNDRIINKDNREEIMMIYNVEKSYTADTLLYTKASAEQKTALLAKYFSKAHPVISNVSLAGRKWFDLRCYDIVDIDLRRVESNSGRESVVKKSFIEKADTRNIMGVENTESRVFVTTDFDKPEIERRFIGRIRGKITGVQKNTKNDTVKISVVKLEDILI